MISVIRRCRGRDIHDVTGYIIPILLTPLDRRICHRMTLINKTPADQDRGRGGLALETRRKRQIPNKYYATAGELPREIVNIERVFRNQHPRARLVCSSALYNCGGLVFGSRRVWIEPDHFRQILADDGYVTATLPFQPGDIVLYEFSEEIAHVGFVHCVSPVILPGQNPEVWVRSKWGPAGEYVHEIKDVPVLFGRPLETFRFGEIRK